LNSVKFSDKPSGSHFRHTWCTSVKIMTPSAR
jgi:hypothetical protein